MFKFYCATIYTYIYIYLYLYLIIKEELLLPIFSSNFRIALIFNYNYRHCHRFSEKKEKKNVSRMCLCSDPPCPCVPHRPPSQPNPPTSATFAGLIPPAPSFTPSAQILLAARVVFVVTHFGASFVEAVLNRRDGPGSERADASPSWRNGSTCEGVVRGLHGGHGGA